VSLNKNCFSFSGNWDLKTAEFRVAGRETDSLSGSLGMMELNEVIHWFLDVRILQKKASDNNGH
jgi:hypothetical protein